VGKERWLPLPGVSKPGRCLVGPAAQSFELVHGPSDEMLVDAQCEEAKLGAVEGSVVFDPASHLRVDVLGEAGQVRATATFEMPGPYLRAFAFLAFALMAGRKFTKNPLRPRTR
jgi:hypothetical protein